MPLTKVQAGLLEATGTPSAGTFLRGDGSWSGTLVLGTAVTCAGQTSIDFTGIPSWARRVTVMFNGVSTSGTSGILVQIGDSGGIENTGYVSGTSAIGNGSVGSLVTSTAGIVVASGTAAASTNSGAVTLINVSGNGWVASGTLYYSGAATFAVAGNKTLSDTLTQVRITTINGTDTFDTTPSAGTVNILYEG